jgi:hypothetical protein
MNDITPIGAVTMYFDENGNFQSGNFMPETMQINSGDLIDRISFVDSHAKEGTMKAQAELILGSWWARMNRIELADRDEYDIKSETLECIRYPDTDIAKKWTLHFSLVKKQTDEKVTQMVR